MDEKVKERFLRDADSAMDTIGNAVPIWGIPGFYMDKEGHWAAKRLMEVDVQAAYTTALAYRITKRASYADKARKLIDGWASVNEEIAGHDGPLVSAYLGVGFIRAAIWLGGYPGWTESERVRFAEWLNRVCLPLWESIPGRNNWWDWSLYARMALHVWEGNRTAIADVVSLLKRQIDSAIDGEGFLTEEAKRGQNGMWYHYFALAPMTAAAKLALDATGEDLFHWVSPGGRSIKQALDTLFRYADGRVGEWPYEPGQSYPDPLAADTWPAELYEAMAIVYREPAYERFVAPYRPVSGHRNSESGCYLSYAWTYPALQLDAGRNPTEY